jgi:hypothetical protein
VADFAPPPERRQMPPEKITAKIRIIFYSLCTIYKLGFPIWISSTGLIVRHYHPAGNMPTLWGHAFQRYTVLERRLGVAASDDTVHAVLQA